MGFALRVAQAGDKHPDAVPLEGFKGSGVLEVIEDHDGDTYRTVYTVRLSEAIFDLVKKRLKSAEDINAALKASAELAQKGGQ